MTSYRMRCVLQLDSGRMEPDTILTEAELKGINLASALDRGWIEVFDPAPATTQPPASEQRPAFSRFDLDPATLQDATVDALKALVLERDPTATVEDMDKDACIAILSIDFVPATKP